MTWQEAADMVALGSQEETDEIETIECFRRSQSVESIKSGSSPDSLSLAPELSIFAHGLMRAFPSVGSSRMFVAWKTQWKLEAWIRRFLCYLTSLNCRLHGRPGRNQAGEG